MRDSKIIILGQKYLGVPRGAVKISFPAADGQKNRQTDTILERALDIVSMSIIWGLLGSKQSNFYHAHLWHLPRLC